MLSLIFWNPYHIISNSDCTPISVVAVFMCFGIDISRYKIEMNNADLKNSGAWTKLLTTKAHSDECHYCNKKYTFVSDCNA